MLVVGNSAQNICVTAPSLLNKIKLFSSKRNNMALQLWFRIRQISFNLIAPIQSINTEAPSVGILKILKILHLPKKPVTTIQDQNTGSHQWWVGRVEIPRDKKRGFRRQQTVVKLEKFLPNNWVGGKLTTDQIQSSDNQT